jgi:hypothetical protein
MAGAITVIIKIDHINGGQKQIEAQRPVRSVQATRGGTAGIQDIGTGDTAIALGSVATVGNFYFRNDDDAAVIDVGVYVSSVFYPFATLKPGEHGSIRGKSGAVYYAKSSVAGGNLWVNIHEA